MNVEELESIFRETTKPEKSLTLGDLKEGDYFKFKNDPFLPVGKIYRLWNVGYHEKHKIIYGYIHGYDFGGMELFHEVVKISELSVI